MLIGKLAKETNASHDTIRYYESLGLLDAPPRPNRFNNYKDYPESNVARIGFICELQSYGFTLREIDEIMKMSKKENFTCGSASPLIEAKLRDVESEISGLEERRLRLNAVAQKLRENPGARKPV